MIKVKHIIVLLIIVIIGIIIVFKFKNNIDINSDIAINILETSSKKITIQNTSHTIIEITELLLKKNSNWLDLPLSDDFLKKYNSNDGVLGKIEFDNIEIRPYTDGKYPFEDFAYFVVTQGKKKTAYEYDFKLANNGLLIDDIIFPKVYYLTDENGQELDARITIDENNYKSCFYSLCCGGDDELSVAVTPNFHKKYPFFLDIFEHYSPLRFNPIKFVPEKSSWEKQEAYFIVDSVLECKKRYYRVKFTLNDKGYLDDVTVNCVNEEEYESSKEYRSNKLFYNNSNWQNLELTYNYKDKFKNSSYNLDIEKIDINYDVKEVLIEEKNYNEYLRLYTMKDGSTSIYYIKYILNDNAYVDDIECKKMPYDNISLKEAKELYLKDYK